MHVMPKTTNSSALGIVQKHQPMTARKNSTSATRVMHNNSIGGQLTERNLHSPLAIENTSLEETKGSKKLIRSSF